jgi:hypothetical protein
VNASTGGATYNGTYTNGPVLANVAGPGASMGRAPKFDGIDDFVQLPASALDSVWNPAEFTIALWCKVVNAGVWGSGVTYVLATFGAGNLVKFIIFKNASNNTLTFAAYLDGTATPLLNVNQTTSTTAWFHAAITASKSGNAIKAYFNGVQVGSTAAYGSATWSGALATAWCTVSSQNGNFYWPGWLAHAALYTRALSAAEVLTLATAV